MTRHVRIRKAMRDGESESLDLSDKNQLRYEQKNVRKRVFTQSCGMIG